MEGDICRLGTSNFRGHIEEAGFGTSSLFIKTKLIGSFHYYVEPNVSLNDSGSGYGFFYQIRVQMKEIRPDLDPQHCSLGSTLE